MWNFSQQNDQLWNSINKMNNCGFHHKNEIKNKFLQYQIYELTKVCDHLTTTWRWKLSIEMLSCMTLNHRNLRGKCITSSVYIQSLISFLSKVPAFQSINLTICLKHWKCNAIKVKFINITVISTTYHWWIKKQYIKFPLNTHGAAINFEPIARITLFCGCGLAQLPFFK